jgi:hypothetical protein
MGNYEIAVLIGWAIAVWALCSVLFSESAEFSNLGTSKRRWFLIELTAFIPYFGIIAVLFYVFKVRVHFPPRPKQPRQPRQASGGGRGGGTGGGWGGTGAPSAPSSWQPPKKQKCTCGNGTVPCGCSGGYVYGTQTERHHPCGGTGRLRCQMCNGSGFR